jgi:hypothetical protein
MSMFMTDGEVTNLTGKKRRLARVTVLRTMGIQHIVRPDGMVLVSKAHVESILGGVIQAGSTNQKEVQPNWESLNA